MLRVVGTSVGHVLESNVGVQAKAFGNGLETIGTKGTFGINVNGLALGAAFGNGHLASDAKRVSQLGLARTEFAKDFSQTPSLDSSLEKLVEFDRPRGESDESPVML